MKIAFFDTKPYDRTSFEKYGKEKGIKFKFYETRLTEDTVSLAKDCDGVCVFVNDNVNKGVIDRLVDMNVKLVALRCAGYNNVDMNYVNGEASRISRTVIFSPRRSRARNSYASHISQKNSQGIYKNERFQLQP